MSLREWEMEQKALERQSSENVLEYVKRLVRAKMIDKTIETDFVELAPLIFDKNLNSNECRKRIYGIQRIIELEDLLAEAETSTIPKTHLQRLRGVIGEYDEKKRLMQLQRNELMKLKRELIPTLALTEELWMRMEKMDFKIEIPEYCYTPIESDSMYKMVLNISDWHIGYLINNCKGNYFNWEIANRRIDTLIQKTIDYIKMYDIKHIYVINTGDTLEHSYLRKNQSQFCEFGLSEQINKSIELIYRLLMALNEHAFIDFYSLPGNHDRINGDKTASYKGDNANVIITRQLYKYNQISGNVRMNIHQLHPYDEEIILEINGTKHKFIHGDGKTNNGKKLLQQEMSMDDDKYNLWKGHLHNFNVISENNGRYIISTGCLSGYNDYSKKFGCSTVASQTIGIIGDGEIELIKDVQLY